MEADSTDEHMDCPTPLSTIPPHSSTSFAPDWVLKKVEELKACVGISCASY